MAFPLLPLAIGAGASLLGGALTRGRGAGRDERRYRGQADAAMGRLGTYGNAWEDRYLSGLEGFDPEAAYGSALTAELDDYDDEFGRRFSGQLGSMVGQGRSPAYSGFGLRDAQETVRQGQRERGRIRQASGERLAQTRLGLLDRMGDYALGTRNMYLDAVTGRLNTLEGQRLTDNASRRDFLGGLLGAAGTAAGAYYGSRR